MTNLYIYIHIHLYIYSTAYRSSVKCWKTTEQNCKVSFIKAKLKLIAINKPVASSVTFPCLPVGIGFMPTE